MSKVQVDTIVDKEDKSAPTLSKGAIVTGVCTATTFVGAVTGDVTGNADTATTATNAQGLTGTPNITVGNVTSANVTNSKQTTSEHVNVTGISTLGGDVSIADKIIHTGDTDTAIRFSGADTITAETGGSERLRITSTGLVGIGDDSPTYPTELKVTDTSAYSSSTIDSTQHQIRINNAGASGVSGILLTAEPSSGSAGHAGIRVISPSSGSADMTFSARNMSTYEEKLRLRYTGAIGLAGANYGTSGQVLTSAGANAAASWGDVSAGMSEYDVWTIDYETSTGVFADNIIGQTTGEGSPVTVNLSRVTTTQNPRFAKVGTGMTVSSGTWTFPSTGYWEVIFTPNGYSTGAAQKTWKVKTTDNNSTYTDAYWTYGYGGIYTQESEVQHSYFNITDVSNQKIQFIMLSGGVNYAFYGSSSKVLTNWVFKKVA